MPDCPERKVGRLGFRTKQDALTVVILVEGTFRTNDNKMHDKNNSSGCPRSASEESVDFGHWSPRRQMSLQNQRPSSGVRLPLDERLSLVSSQLTEAGLAVSCRSRDGLSHPKLRQRQDTRMHVKLIRPVQVPRYARAWGGGSL